MSSYKINSENRAAHIFITLVMVVLFSMIQGFTPACAGDVSRNNEAMATVVVSA